MMEKLKRLMNNISGVKRKSIVAMYTQCQHTDCQKVWLDKIYGPGHKVVCPYCHRVQYDENWNPIKLDDMDIQALRQWGLARDIAADGELGGLHERPSRKSDIFTWEQFEEIYGKKKEKF